MHASDPNTWEIKAGNLGVLSHSYPHNKSKTTLSYVRSDLKKRKKEGKQKQNKQKILKKTKTLRWAGEMAQLVTVTVCAG